MVKAWITWKGVQKSHWCWNLLPFWSYPLKSLQIIVTMLFSDSSTVYDFITTFEVAILNSAHIRDLNTARGPYAHLKQSHPTSDVRMIHEEWYEPCRPLVTRVIQWPPNKITPSTRSLHLAVGHSSKIPIPHLPPGFQPRATADADNWCSHENGKIAISRRIPNIQIATLKKSHSTPLDKQERDSTNSPFHIQFSNFLIITIGKPTNS